MPSWLGELPMCASYRVAARTRVCVRAVCDITSHEIQIVIISMRQTITFQNVQALLCALVLAGMTVLMAVYK